MRVEILVNLSFIRSGKIKGPKLELFWYPNRSQICAGTDTTIFKELFSIILCYMKFAKTKYKLQ